MTQFEMIKYHGQTYPDSIPLRIEELAAHFDITKVNGQLGWSLHTEYSYGKRALSNPIIDKFPELQAAQRDGVPQLWKSEKWAFEFASFMSELVGTAPAPKVIEVHPPFSDYTNMQGFVQSYTVFESLIKELYPNVVLLIENRCGSVYHGGKFILSKVSDIESLGEQIYAHNLALRVAYDVPQIYTAHNAKTEKQFTSLLEQTKPLTGCIGGVHLWGKRISESGRKVAHCGNLNTYFANASIKDAFLDSFVDCFNDDSIRKMVLEVNSGNEDLLSIVSDLVSKGTQFV